MYSLIQHDTTCTLVMAFCAIKTRLTFITFFQRFYEEKTLYKCAPTDNATGKLTQIDVQYFVDCAI